MVQEEDINRFEKETKKNIEVGGFKKKITKIISEEVPYKEGETLENRLNFVLVGLISNLENNKLQILT